MTDRHIAVFSGSFNPLHIGHLAIIRYLVEESGFDCVYLIVSPKNPLKDNISENSGKERYDAAVAAVERHFGPSQDKVIVNDIELTMPAPHYTIRTLEVLRRNEPHTEFTFIMGADSLADIRRWKDYGRILKDFGVAVYPRKGTDILRVREDLLREDPKYKIRVIDSDFVEISSSSIREGLRRGKDMSSWLM